MESKPAAIGQSVWEEYMGIVSRTVSALTLTAGLAIAAAPFAQAQEEYDWPAYFTVVTPVVGTGNHSLSVAWTSEFSAQTSSRARVLPAPNGYARAEWLNTGEADIVMVQTSDYFDQMDAAAGYATIEAGPTDTRVIGMNLILPWGYMVQGDSELKSITDIGPETRVALSPSSSFLVTGIEAMLAYQNMTLDDVSLVEVGNYGANTKVVVEGRADVAFTSPVSGPSFEAEASPAGIRWLSLPPRADDPEAYDRLRAKHPGYVEMQTSAGVKSALGLQMDHVYQPNHMLADADPDFVYNLIKWQVEHHKDFVDDFTYADMMSLESIEKFLEVGARQPFHEGLIRYLKEKNIWTDAYQERQDKLVALATERVALWQKTVEAAQAEGTDISPDSTEFQDLWAKAKQDSGITKSYGELVLALD